MLFSSAFAQNPSSEWVDSVFHALTLEEKIGQLFVIPIAADSLEGGEHDRPDILKPYTPGGVLITPGEIDDIAQRINRLQRFAGVPLLIGISTAWGLGQVLEGIPSLLEPMAIAAIHNTPLLYEAGRATARQMKALGIQMNVVTPGASSNRSIDHVQRICVPAFLNGLRRSGILVYAHSAFPATDKKKSSNKLRYDEVDGVLLSDTSTLSNKNISPPSTYYSFVKRLKKKHPNNLLLIQTRYSDSGAKTLSGEVEKRMLMAGADMFICEQQHAGKSIRSIGTEAATNKRLRKKIYRSVKRVLTTKYTAEFADATTTDREVVPDDFDSTDMRILRNRLAAAAITIAKNDIDHIPIRTLSNRRFAVLSIGTGHSDSFEHYLDKFASFTKYTIRHARDTAQLSRTLSGFDNIVIGVYDLDTALIATIIPWINALKMKQKIILCVFSNPHNLTYLEELPSVVIAYTDKEPMPMLVAQIIFGTGQGKGNLPFGLNPWLAAGQGMVNGKLDRLGYSLPEMVGMDGATLGRIDHLAQVAIDSGATPGCVVLIARDGKVIFEKAYGWHTYEKQKRVMKNDIYDLASITKVAATLQAIAILYDNQRLNIDTTVSTYLPELKDTDKSDIVISDILTHQAGLWPFVPFWKKTITDSTQRSYYYSTTVSKNYPLPVAKNMFARRVMRDSLWQWTIQTPLMEKRPGTLYKYKYSDMGFYIMHRLAEKQLAQPMVDFLEQKLYKSLGAYTMGYLPLNRFPVGRIVPTEVDTLFRHSTITGFVHDQGAAMYGGVAGHAGLFSDANDLAKLGQLWLQHGRYGGVDYFDSTTVERFTTTPYASNRRGLGWDKPNFGEWYGPTSLSASPKTFGHTGFTGTAIWMDPVFNTTFVFLSNRVYPNAENKKLLTMNIRTRIQDIIYLAIFNYCQYKQRTNR